MNVFKAVEFALNFAIISELGRFEPALMLLALTRF